MPTLPKSIKAIERLERVRNYLQYYCQPWEMASIAKEATKMNRPYDRAGMTIMLEDYCIASALVGWHDNGDLKLVKNLFYNMGELEYISVVKDWRGSRFRRFTYKNTTKCMPLLISDHPALINWCAKTNFGLKDGKDQDNPHHYEYLLKNIYLAMRKEWKELEERCRRYIANPRKSLYSWLHNIEYECQLALATGDIPKMEEALAKIVSRKGLSKKNRYENAFSVDLISSCGLIYAKLAWMNGHEVNINSPYIPQEWLPVQPLDHYEDEFDFMKAYTIDPTKGATSIPDSNTNLHSVNNRHLSAEK